MYMNSISPRLKIKTNCHFFSVGGSESALGGFVNQMIKMQLPNITVKVS